MNEPAVGGSRLFSIWAGGEFGAGSGSAAPADPRGVFEAVQLPPRRDRRLDIAAPEGATV
jgi:hypothetical protein